jgi:DNA-binding NarL/FixJ family response regulator
MERVTAAAYHVVVLDSQLRDADCVTLVSRIVEVAPTSRILLLLEENDQILLLGAIKRGAHSAVCKWEAVQEIVAARRTV